MTITVTTTVAAAGTYTVNGIVGQLIPDSKPDNNAVTITASTPPPPVIAVKTVVAPPTLAAPPAAGKRFVISFGVHGTNGQA